MIIRIPDKPGRYLISCAESDYDFTEVYIYLEDGVLKVDCPDLGRGYLLQHYHDGLTEVMWINCKLAV